MWLFDHTTKSPLDNATPFGYISITTLQRESMPRPLRHAEFFAGIGLVRLALERFGFQTVFANDISADKFEIYAQNFDASVFLLKDVRKVRPEEVPDCDLATACFPCTDISLAGERNGLRGEESSTFWSFIKLLRGKKRKPPFILIENVEGLLTSERGKDFQAVVRALNALGYCCDAYLPDASGFVPQSRRRVIIVGAAARHLNGQSRTKPTPSWVRPPTLIRAISHGSDLNWFFEEVPAIAPSCELKLADVIEDVPAKSNRWWESGRVQRLLGQMARSHRAVVEWAARLSEVKHLPVYRRTRPGGPRAEVRADGLAGCLRTARGGSSRQILIVAGKGDIKVRFMTPREYARLQGVPDSFRLDTAESNALFGLGDAVCVPVIEWIVEYCLGPLVRQREENHPHARPGAPLGAAFHSPLSAPR